MKYNKIPGHLMKIMCVVVSAILLICFCFSCVDVNAEGSLEWMDVIFQYEDDFRLKLIDVNRKTVEAVNNSNLSDSQKQQALKILAIQELALRTMPDIYGNPINPIIPDSDTVIFSQQSVTSAIYQLSSDNKYYPVSLYPVSGGKYPWIAATSQHFNISISLSGYLQSGNFPSVTRYNEYGVNGSTSTGFWFSGSGQNRHIYFTDKSGFFQDYELQTGGCYFYISSTTIPTFTQGQRLSFTGAIGGLGTSVTTPEGEVPSISPWDYYNRFVLPYITNNFDIDNIDQYIAFPNGYYPDSVPPSQQYPSGGGVSIGDQYYFDIDINFPTYPNGEPQTDESGETITETVIVTDTRPTDAVYNFTVPTLPGLQIDSSPIPFNTNISEYTNPLLGFFDLITQIFDASGVLPVIPILFTMGIIFFVIYKCS